MQVPVGSPVLACRGESCQSPFCWVHMKRWACDLARQMTAAIMGEVEGVPAWGHVFMITLTHNPDHFLGGPVEAYRYVRKRKCIAKFIARLVKWGYLAEHKYLCIMETQPGSGWPHYHVLVDAARIPKRQIERAWNACHKGSAAAIAAGRPGFGSVRFSAQGLKEKARAVRYVTGYMCKGEIRWADWVYDQPKGSVKVFTCSVGALGKVERPEVAPTGLERKRVGTIGDQVAGCGRKTRVLVEQDYMREGGEVVRVRRVVGTYKVPPVVAYEVVARNVVRCGATGVVRERPYSVELQYSDELMQDVLEVFPKMEGPAGDQWRQRWDELHPVPGSPAWELDYEEYQDKARRARSRTATG